MKIAHYYPNPFMNLFTKHLPDVEFINNKCDSSVDVIYCGSISMLPAANDAKYRYKKPMVCWVWDIPTNWRTWFIDDPDGLRENEHRDQTNKERVNMLKNCDMVISASKFTQNTLKQAYNTDSEQLYFYIDTDGLDRVKQPEKKDQAVQISRYFYNKRFDISIQAIMGLPYDLACIGTVQSPTYYTKLQHIINNKSIRNAHLYPNIDRTKCISILKESKLLISPSIFEGWGITPIEALYCGIPVILNDMPVFREVYGDCVLYHKQDDYDDLRDNIRELMSDKKTQQDMVNQGRTIIKDFTPVNFARRWKDLISTLM